MFFFFTFGHWLSKLPAVAPADFHVSGTFFTFWLSTSIIWLDDQFKWSWCQTIYGDPQPHYRQPHGPRLKGGVESHGDAVEDVHHQEGGRLHPGHLHHQARWHCWSSMRQIQRCLLTKRFLLWISINLLVKNGPDENADADKIGEAVPGKRCSMIAHFSTPYVNVNRLVTCRRNTSLEQWHVLQRAHKLR